MSKRWRWLGSNSISALLIDCLSGCLFSGVGSGCRHRGEIVAFCLITAMMNYRLTLIYACVSFFATMGGFAMSDVTTSFVADAAEARISNLRARVGWLCQLI